MCKTATIAQGQVADGLEQLYQLFVALGNRRTKFVGVDIQVVEQSLEFVFTATVLGGGFDSLEHGGKGFVEVGIMTRPFTHIGE